MVGTVKALPSDWARIADDRPKLPAIRVFRSLVLVLNTLPLRELKQIELLSRVQRTLT